jgi:hypothetical protein
MAGHRAGGVASEDRLLVLPPVRLEQEGLAPAAGRKRKQSSAPPPPVPSIPDFGGDSDFERAPFLPEEPDAADTLNGVRSLPSGRELGAALGDTSMASNNGASETALLTADEEETRIREVLRRLLHLGVRYVVLATVGWTLTSLSDGYAWRAN